MQRTTTTSTCHTATADQPHAERSPTGCSMRQGWLALVLATVALPAFTDAAAQEPAPLTVYTGPQRVEGPAPVYPKSALSRGGDGWVHLNFMVDTAGKPYEIVVSDSFGHPALKEAAIRALERSTYIPAKLGDAPLDAGSSETYRFEISGRPSVSRATRTRYGRLLRLVREDDKAEADELMAKLADTTRRNLYEDAWLNLAMFSYYEKWGTVAQQLRALNRAVAYHAESKYLPPRLFALAQLDRFRLFVRTRDYASAMSTFRILEPLDIDDQRREKLEATVQQLAALQANDSAYSVPGQVQADAHWHYNLFKDDFALQEVQGEIAELKLRCDKKFVFFRFDPQMHYRIADSGHCHLTVVGNPDTTFQLTQW